MRKQIPEKIKSRLNKIKTAIEDVPNTVPKLREWRPKVVREVLILTGTITRQCEKELVRRG